MLYKKTYTPGPWIPVTGSRTNMIKGIRSKGYRNVINFGGISSPCSEEGRANAHLLLAAPDLLEALKEMIRPRNEGAGSVERRQMAKDAIAKAEERVEE
jgi:hypothetical protein